MYKYRVPYNYMYTEQAIVFTKQGKNRPYLGLKHIGNTNV